MAKKNELTHTATLHGAESYTADGMKFQRGKVQNVTEALASRLPRHKFSISLIATEVAEEAEAKKGTVAKKGTEGKK